MSLIETNNQLFKLINIFTRFTVAIADEELNWSPTMIEAYNDFLKEAEVKGPPVLTPYYECPYCTKRYYNSYNGTGSDISCCGEVGHALTFYELTRQNP